MINPAVMHSFRVVRIIRSISNIFLVEKVDNTEKTPWFFCRFPQGANNLQNPDPNGYFGLRNVVKKPANDPAFLKTNLVKVHSKSIDPRQNRLRLNTL